MRIRNAVGIPVIVATVIVACVDEPVHNASSTIGPDGGFVTIEGASLTIPAGALDAPVTIQLSSGIAPAGAVSSLYMMKPSSLALAKAATVKVQYSGASAPAMMWSAGSTGTYVSLPTQVLGSGWASAEITQLGSVYVLGGGGNDAGSNDGSVVDGAVTDGSADGAVTDGSADGSDGAADAALDGGACVNPPPALNLPAGTPGSYGSLPKGSYGCMQNSVTPVAPSVYTFTLASSAQVTMAYTHNLVTQLGAMHLVTGCDANGSVLATAAYCHSSSKVLAPGTYSWVLCMTGGGSFAAASPPASPPNVACNAGVTLPVNGSVAEPGIVDGMQRVYTFTNATTQPTQLSFGNATFGSISVSVRTDCTNASTSIKNVAVDLCAAGTANPVDLGTIAGTYYVVVTATDSGQRYTIGLTHN